ncbi:MarR family winged helix-turn-helix transcriptional regulator [Thalassospira sp. ER-Se-21-Dark]|uniref:MarR family winged helix-turn-helix transcriptional regulator n=1 Tax=Thalassospira sp. ER-Se-21-Dark TaxID=2585190 RepID=UPI001B30AF8D|nr:MarR family winged helix-turn-helix transcriptional regulator [Thalassospira sp. ER-Se-21-Dark]MBP3126806.1 winged helix-turn-helix transcriptional regulator [Thalassospira sp. ER-Se-21-Dark]
MTEEDQVHVPGETLHRLVHAYKRRLMHAMQAASMPMPISHKRVMKWIVKIPGITAQQMAEKSGQDKGRITRLLKELENDGLIERCPHPEDRRSQTLHLTAAGSAKMEDFRAVEKEVRSRMTSGLTPQQIHDFVEIANLMSDNLETHKCKKLDFAGDSPPSTRDQGVKK